MEKFIKVITITGDKYYSTSKLLVIEVDNNSPIDWFIRGVFSEGLGSFALVDGIDNETDARDIAHELASSMGLINGGIFQ